MYYVLTPMYCLNILGFPDDLHYILIEIVGETKFFLIVKFYSIIGKR